ncbi:MAG: cyclase family protein [Gemmatimonadales bacterium]
MGRIGLAAALVALVALSARAESGNEAPVPREVVDLGALVTPDLPLRMNGTRWLNEFGARPNSFDVVHWENGPISGQNSYYTFFNHGGPHVDAPIHFGLGGGLNTYDVESFSGRLRVFDVRGYPPGYTVPSSAFEGQEIRVGDIVVIYTGYAPPPESEYPKSVTLTRAAAEYLANIPIRAFGTDSYSAGSRDGTYPVAADTEFARRAPVHEAFLAKSIPIYEALQNLDVLLDRKNLYFVGVPLNIENGDGMLVRPVVFVY